MRYDKRIHELSEELQRCEDDGQALRLSRELRSLLHEHVEELRSKVSGAPMPAEAAKKTKRPLVLCVIQPEQTNPYKC